MAQVEVKQNCLILLPKKVDGDENIFVVRFENSFKGKVCPHFE
jgi:hypothetical protein